MLDGPWRENGILGPPGQWLGWYADLDAALIDPHIDSHLDSGSNIKALFLTPSTPTGSVQTQCAAGQRRRCPQRLRPPHPTANRSAELGGQPVRASGLSPGQRRRRRAAGLAKVASQGNGTLADFDAAGTGLLQSRLNVQSARLTYGTSEFSPDVPTINSHLVRRFGVAAADVFFDSQARGQQALFQKASNHFAGVGPTLAFLFWKPLTPWGLNLFGELNATGLIGFTRQRFGETIVVDGQTYSDFVSLEKQSNGVGIFGAQGGFSYAPWEDRTSRFRSATSGGAGGGRERAAIPTRR